MKRWNEAVLSMFSFVGRDSLFKLKQWGDEMISDRCDTKSFTWFSSVILNKILYKYFIKT